MEMTDKSRIFKARFTIADLRQQRNHKEVFTTSLTKNETLDHFILKLLGYSFLSYDSSAQLNTDKNLPDVSIKAFDEHYTKWLSVDEPDLKRLLKVAKLVDEFIILTKAHSQWLDQARPQLSRLPNNHLIEIDSQFIDQIKQHLTRNLEWDITIDHHSVSISDQANYYYTKQFNWH